MKKTEIIVDMLAILLVSIIFLLLKDSSNARFALLGAVVFIALLITRRILPNNITDIFIRDNNTTTALSLEAQERLIEILSEERGFLSLKKKCVCDDRVLVIKSKKKQLNFFIVKAIVVKIS